MAETQNAGSEAELEPEIEEQGGSQEPSQPKEKEDELSLIHI